MPIEIHTTQLMHRAKNSIRSVRIHAAMIKSFQSNIDGSRILLCFHFRESSPEQTVTFVSSRNETTKPKREYVFCHSLSA